MRFLALFIYSHQHNFKRIKTFVILKVYNSATKNYCYKTECIIFRYLDILLLKIINYILAHLHFLEQNHLTLTITVILMFLYYILMSISPNSSSDGNTIFSGSRKSWDIGKIPASSLSFKRR
jgi:hypothetical protein